MSTFFIKIFGVDSNQIGLYIPLVEVYHIPPLFKDCLPLANGEFDVWSQTKMSNST